MRENPIMAKIFDVVEEQRAIPNGRTPFDNQIKIERNVVYKTVDGEELLMDIYYPSHPLKEGRAPAVLDIPGGGWMIRNRVRRDGYAKCYARLGAVVFVIEHRLCPKIFFPADLEDCIDAYNFIVDNQDKYNIDANNICVTGDSSGGHMTACLGCVATSEEYVQTLGLPHLKTKPANLIFISGAFDFEVMYRIPLTHTLMVRYVSGQSSRKAFRNWQYYKQINVYNYLNSDFPECYNNGGATDPLCAGEARRMAKKLDAVGVKNEYQVGKNLFNSAHCYVLRFPFAPARRDMLKLYTWYVQKQAERGVDMSQNYQVVKHFFENYKNDLKDSKK